MADDVAIGIDSVDQGRQALAALKGYRHQLFATALAWGRLPPDGYLLVEVAEDYATVVKQALTAFQVKSGSRVATLRSGEIVGFINAFWRLQRANPSLKVNAVYLTTSEAGREQGAAFPGGACGLDYWREAAREGVDTKPLRAFLQKLALEPELRAWLEAAGDDDVREALLTRIRWALGAPAASELEQLLLDAVMSAGERFGLAPSDAAKASDAVVMTVLAAASGNAQRTLTRTEFLACIEKTATIAMPLSALRRAAASTASAPAIVTAVEDVPTAPNVVTRDVVCNSLRERLATHGCVWLHGATGLGKTSLALEATRQSNRRWVIVPLRGLDAQSLTTRLAEARRATGEADFGGLILDDLPDDLALSARLELSVLAGAVRHTDGGLICTAYRAPPPSLSLGTWTPAPMTAPYFTSDEVGRMVRQAGGDPETWASIVRVFASDGHPQLVAARIAGLKARGWPDDERLAGLDPSMPLIDLETERDAIRLRLLRELPAEASGLLARLTACVASFDRQLAVAIGSAPPPIPTPGLHFEVLVGPWVESTGRDRFRISPLVADAGEKTLSDAEMAAVHAAIVEDVSERRPVPGERLGQLLLSSLRTQNQKGLGVVAMATMMVEGPERRLLAQELAGLGLLRTDRPPFLPDPMTSATLRLAQLRIAVFSEASNVKAILNALMGELAGLETEQDLIAAAVGTVLMAEANFLTAAEWLALLPRVSDAPIKDRPTDSGWSLRTFGFVWRVSHLGSISRLVELYEALDAIDPAIRTGYLSALQDPLIGVRAMVQEPWVADAKRPEFDPQVAVQHYAGLVKIAEQWGFDTVVIECVGSQAVLLAEYAKDEAAALAILDQAIIRWPGHPRLIRETTKILLRQGDFAGAYARLRIIASLVPATDYLDQFYVSRELAVSAANVGDLGTAVEAFGRAHDAATQTATIRAKAAGVLADRAWVEFRLGRRADSVHSLHAFLREAERLNPKDRQVEFLLRMVGHLLQWMINMLEPSQAGEALTEPVYGFCSRDAPDYEWPQPLVPLEGLWYQLEELEYVLSEALGISSEVGRRVDGRRIELFEFRRTLRALERAVAQPDARVLIAGMAEACPMAMYLQDQGKERFGLYEIKPATAWSTIPFNLGEMPQLRVASNAATAWLSIRRFIAGVDDTELLTHALAASDATAALASLLSEADFGTDDPSLAADKQILAELPVLLGDVRTDAKALYGVSFRFWDWLRSTTFRRQAAEPIAKAATDRWLWVLENAQFGLRQPSRTTPAIAEACTRPPGFGQLASLLLAAEDAVYVRLGTEARAGLQKAAGD